MYWEMNNPVADVNRQYQSILGVSSNLMVSSRSTKTMQNEKRDLLAPYFLPRSAGLVFDFLFLILKTRSAFFIKPQQTGKKSQVLAF